MGFFRSKLGLIAVVGAAFAVTVASVAAVSAHGPGDDSAERPKPKAGGRADRGLHLGQLKRDMPQIKGRGQEALRDLRDRLAAAQGTIAALSATDRSVTIDSRSDRKGGDAQPVTVKITDQTHLHKDGKPATFDQLAVGDRAMSVYQRDSGEAQLINAFTPREEREKLAKIHGTISALDTATKAVTIAPKEGDEVKVTVTTDTHLHKNGRPATFDNLAVGDRAEAVYVKESGEARGLNSHSPREHFQKYAIVRGEITALDAAAKKVTIDRQGRHGEVVVEVSDLTRLIKDGQPATFDKLAVGDRVLAVYENGSNKAELVIAVSPPAGV